MRVALVAPLVSAIAQPYLGGAQALLADLAQGLFGVDIALHFLHVMIRSYLASILSR